MKKYKVSIDNCYEFSSQDINDIIAAALEGGINYWCGKVSIVMANANENGIKYKGVLPEDNDKIEYSSDVIGFGGELLLKDIEDSNETWILTLEKILKGIKIYCKKHSVQLNNLMEYHDADMADCIVQYALFDELIFA